jgi:hypothetical protein
LRVPLRMSEGAIGFSGGIKRDPSWTVRPKACFALAIVVN